MLPIFSGFLSLNLLLENFVDPSKYFSPVKIDSRLEANYSYEQDKSIDQRDDQRLFYFDYGIELFDDPTCKISDDKFEFGARVARREIQVPPAINPWDDRQKITIINILGKNQHSVYPQAEGYCLDTSKDRPAILLSPSDRRQIFPEIEADEFEFVANIEGQSGFYTAAFPITKIQSLHFIVNNNKYIGKKFGTHSHILVKFSSEVLLKPQKGNQSQENITAHSFIFSIQSAKPVELFDRSSTADGSRLLAYTIQLADYKIYEDFISVFEIDSITAIKLDFPNKLTEREYVSQYIRKASRRFSRYFLVNYTNVDANQSCNIEQIRLLDRIIGFQEDPFLFFRNPAAFIGRAAPHLVYKALKLRGLAKEKPIELKTFEEAIEFSAIASF